MEVKTKKFIAREILFFVKMAGFTVVGVVIAFIIAGLGELINKPGIDNYFAGFILYASLAIYPIALLVRLLNWAKETVNKEE